MTPNIIHYKEAIIVTRKNGVDIIDPKTNCWTTAKSIQAAKWNLSVWRRLCVEFSFAKGNLKLA